MENLSKLTVALLVINKYFKLLIIILNLSILIKNVSSAIDYSRYSPFNSLFNNPYDYADSQSYASNLFSKLLSHMNGVKRERNKCSNIPLPKTVLNQKYFNPSYELMQYKYWYPPKDHQYVILWSQYESYRNSLFLSYMLQNDNAKFPPGWLYLYLSTAAQLHSLQKIGFNSHKIIKAIKLPFESNEVFKVNWWNNGNYQKFDKPFALYATQPREEAKNLVRVIDFGVGNYSNDYTGHAFLGNYLYDRQQFILNNSYEYSNYWKRPYQSARSSSQNENEQNNLVNQQPKSVIQDQQQSNRLINNNQQQPYMQIFQNKNTLGNNQKLMTDNSVYNPNVQKQQIEQQMQQKQQKNDLTSFLQSSNTSIENISPFIYVNKNNIPITDWDPLVDTDRNNLNRVPNRDSPMGFDQWYLSSIVKNTVLETFQKPNENPFVYKSLKYIESYRFAKVWWNNESAFLNNIQEYVYRIKPEEKFYKFSGAKLGEGVTWSSPYFWCVDPTNWIVTSMTPIWAINDREYKNKIFASDSIFRFVGLSEVVLNYEELDVNQCPGDRQLNAFSSTALCDSTVECLPLALYGLSQGGYECQCINGYHFPENFQGPFKGVDLFNANVNSYPLCLKSERLLKYPNWVSKNSLDYAQPNSGTLVVDPNLNNIYKRSVEIYPDLKKINSFNGEIKLNIKTNKPKIENKKKPKKIKRFIDKRNNFEKLRDLIFADQTYLWRKCLTNPLQDVNLLLDDDERFISNLKYHANEVFKPQTAQAIRIGHILSAYLQLHSPFASSSLNSQNNFGIYNNLGNILKPDPQLDEHIVVGEIMSTLLAHFPLQEVNVFFNGTEYAKQRLFSNQDILGFGISMIRSDVEVLLNRSNDDSHLSKSWYLDAINKYMFSKIKSPGKEYYSNENEKKYYQNAGYLDASSTDNSFDFQRYSIEINLRKSFDGTLGTVDLPVKSYDAPSSGIWFGPYFDCQKRYLKTKTTLRLSYSVPIVTSMTKTPLGFVSIVVGSDLKWWKINPCDTSGVRNMFQNIHKCDAETTLCAYQNIPDFENGYYLASYKCICKANYEFPYMDYGSSYFEGATVEREYEKKSKGLPNIYDRLKCRLINSLGSNDRQLWNGESSFYQFRFKLTKNFLYLIISIISQKSFKIFIIF